ncbi:hypothetical protein GCM10022221_53420 [Actinocorallia aurea]
MNSEPEPAPWRKSSRSDSIGNCVELMGLGDSVGVRDSKNPGAGLLVVRKGALRRLVWGARSR